MPVFESLQQAIDRVQNLGGGGGYRDKETNVVAVVLECTLPRATRGSDFVVNVQLVDASRYHAAADPAEQLEPIELIVFSKQAELMPQVRGQPGDIIVLRHVMVQFWEPSGGARRPQLFGKMSKPHSFGFSLYPARAPVAPAGGQPGAVNAVDSEKPYQSYHVAAFGGQQEMQKLTQLREFSAQICRPGNAAQDTATIYLRRIKDLEMPEDPNERPECVDMRVKVLAIDKRAAAEQVVLYVWDGTDAKPLPAEQQWPACMWKNSELSLSHPKRCRIMPLKPEPPNLVVDDNIPPLGSTVPVIIEPQYMPRNNLPCVGSWVKLKVVGLTSAQGQLQVVYGKDSRLNPSGPGNSFEPNYNKRLSENITSEWPLIGTHIASRCSRSDLQLITLRQMHQKVAQQEVGPFRVRVRLVGYLPKELQQWCKLVWKPLQPAAAAEVEAGPSSPQQQMQQQWDWAAHLLLEDATGDVRALLMGHHATRLLELPPHDLAQHPEDVQQLRERLEYLSSVDQDGGIWLDVALTAVFRAGTGQHQQPEQHGLEQQTSPRQAAAAAAGAERTEAPGSQQQQSSSVMPAGGSLSAQPAGSGAAVPAASGGSAAQQCVFILHDALGLGMLDEGQENGQQDAAQEHCDEPQAKKQCIEEQQAPVTDGAAAGSAAAAAMQQGCSVAEQQELSPESRRQRDQRHAETFM